MIGLFNCPTTGVFFIGHSPRNVFFFAVRLRENRLLNEPIRFEEIVIVPINSTIVLTISRSYCKLRHKTYTEKNLKTDWLSL